MNCKEDPKRLFIKLKDGNNNNTNNYYYCYYEDDILIGTRLAFPEAFAA